MTCQPWTSFSWFNLLEIHTFTEQTRSRHWVPSGPAMVAMSPERPQHAPTCVLHDQFHAPKSCHISLRTLSRVKNCFPVLGIAGVYLASTSQCPYTFLLGHDHFKKLFLFRVSFEFASGARNPVSSSHTKHPDYVWGTLHRIAFDTSSSLAPDRFFRKNLAVGVPICLICC